jgi:hypothetical protein
MHKTTINEVDEALRNLSLKKLIAIKLWYTVGLFTVIYLGILIYDIIFGLNHASEYSALIVIAISVVFSIIDLTLVSYNKKSPAQVAMVLWVSPFYSLYKFFRKVELLNLDSSHISELVKKYATRSVIRNTV